MNKKKENLRNSLNPEEKMDGTDQNEEEVLKELQIHNEEGQKEQKQATDSSIFEGKIEADDNEEERFQQIFESLSANKSLLSKLIELVEINNKRSQYKDEAILRMQKQIGEYEKGIIKSVKETLIRDIILFYDSLTGFYKKFKDEAKSINDFEYEYKLLEDELLDLLYCQNVERINLENNQKYDRTLQKVVRIEPTNNKNENELIIKKILDGFKWDEKILRKQEVVVKKFE